MTSFIVRFIFLSLGQHAIACLSYRDILSHVTRKHIFCSFRQGKTQQGTNPLSNFDMACAPNIAAPPPAPNYSVNTMVALTPFLTIYASVS